jgi:hypothetical protein
MIPATLQFIIAMIASAINERMQRKLDYVQEEVRVLKEVVLATRGKRADLVYHRSKASTRACRQKSPQERRKYCQLVTPATLLAWFRSLGARKYDGSACWSRRRLDGYVERRIAVWFRRKRGRKLPGWSHVAGHRIHREYGVLAWAPVRPWSQDTAWAR